jgi:hypothetical protein
MHDYRTEFPDFDPATMPVWPEGAVDTSWHNEACPSIELNGYTIYIDYADAQQREWDALPRFSILAAEDEHGDVEAVLHTDSWDEVLNFCANAPELPFPLDEAAEADIAAKAALWHGAR